MQQLQTILNGRPPWMRCPSSPMVTQSMPRRLYEMRQETVGQSRLENCRYSLPASRACFVVVNPLAACQPRPQERSIGPGPLCHLMRPAEFPLPSSLLSQGFYSLAQFDRQPRPEPISAWKPILARNPMAAVLAMMTTSARQAPISGHRLL